VLHQVGVSFDLHCDARKHKIKIKRRDVYIVKYFLGFSSHRTEKQTFPVTNTNNIYLRMYLRKISDICVRFNGNWNVLANFM